jgi:alkylation response protein AidB-like acyl-CoA dehydrogenase
LIIEGSKSQIQGGDRIYAGKAFSNDCLLGRLRRNAKLYEIGAGTSEIRRMLICRELSAESMS